MYADATQKITAYDRVATMFSPRGRLYQVEYASKIVEQGTLGIGLIYKNGLMLGAEKNVTSKLLIPSSIEKLFMVDEHIAIISSGLVGDARRLVKIAREKVQENRMLYDERIQIETLVKEISSIKQVFTQYSGMRPFGVSFIIGGIDDTGERLFETEPSGALAEYNAVAIGKGKKEAMKYLEEKYTGKESRKEAVKLIIEAMKKAKEKNEKLDFKGLDFAYIERTGEFERFSPKEILSTGKEK